MHAFWVQTHAYIEPPLTHKDHLSSTRAQRYMCMIWPRLPSSSSNNSGYLRPCARRCAHDQIRCACSESTFCRTENLNLLPRGITLFFRHFRDVHCLDDVLFPCFLVSSVPCLLLTHAPQKNVSTLTEALGMHVHLLKKMHAKWLDDSDILQSACYIVVCGLHGHDCS